MKKFNIDEFIWFMIQLILIILMIYLKVSGKIVTALALLISIV